MSGNVKDKKMGLGSVIATGTGLVVATSCLLTLGQGVGAIGGAFIFSLILACALNMIAIASLSELNGLMPGLSGGLAQYTYCSIGALPAIVAMLGGYIVTNCFTSSTEVAMCGIVVEELFGLGIPPYIVGIAIILILGFVNLMGIDIFAKVQSFVAWTLMGSMLVLGVIGAIGMGIGTQVEQSFFMDDSSISSVLSMVPMAFWLFIGAEFIIPMSGEIKNAKRNVPLGMFLSLGIILVLQIIMSFGFGNYVLWADMAAADSPHLVYGVKLLGNNIGLVWMGIVAILAAVSTVNTVIGSCARICEGLAKMNLLPAIFMKRNSRNAPYAGIILMSAGLITVLAVAKASDASGLTLLILTGCTFWMFAYVIGHINVLVMRRRMPNAPTSFRVPLGPVLPLLGMAGMIWMILTVDPDPDYRLTIYRTVVIALVILSAYGIIWIKTRLKRPLFKPMPVDEMLAMEAAANAKQDAAWDDRIASKVGAASSSDGASGTDDSSGNE